MSYRVLISDAKAETVDHNLQDDVLSQYGAEAISTVTREEETLIERLEEVHGLIVDAAVPVTETVIRRATDLRVIGRAGIGIDNVDLEAAAEKDVVVVHHPTYSIDEVATQAIALMLNCVRGVTRYDRATRAGTWDWTVAAPIPRMQGSTIGLLGFGKVPQRVATMLGGFGCELLAHDPYVDDDIITARNVAPVGFDQLCDRSDILSIHAGLTPETRGMVDADALCRLGPDATVVNTARGQIIDTAALLDQLRGEGLHAVGLDVTDPEPLPADHELFAFENVVVTPHMAWYSEASRVKVSREVATDVGRVLCGEPPERPVELDKPWL